MLRQLTAQIHRINTALDERLLFVTEQSITDKQLSIQRNSLEELRLFNSNVAMKIGDAVRVAIQDGNNAVSTRLSEIANNFSRLVENSGTSAGKVLNEAMKGAFDSSLTQASESIKAIAISLESLPTQLSAAASQIRDAASAAAKEQVRLTDGLQQGLDLILRNAGANISNSLEHGTQGLVVNLKETSSSFGASAAKISEFFDRFNSNGNDYINSLSALTSRSTELQDRMSALCSDIIAATGGLKQASSAVGDNMSQFTKAFGEFARIANETSQNARASQEAVRNTVDALQRQMTSHLERFDDVDERLANVFNTIGSQLELQSRQMSQQLARMDQALAGAVNHFEYLIEGLTGAAPNRVAAE
jgi:hypothetical protein